MIHLYLQIYLYVCITSYNINVLQKHTLKTESGQNKTVFRIRDGSAMYIVQLLFIKDIEHQDPKKNGSLNVSITLEMRNPHGFLSAVDYPALVVSPWVGMVKLCVCV